MNILHKVKSVQFSFGTTSAIITNIALIIGLDSATTTKLPIIGSLLVIALADNISDSLGIHFYQESEGLSASRIWFLTATNFFSRFITSSGFILIVLLFPLHVAVYLSLIYGLSLLSIVSYVIAKSRQMSARYAITEHLVIAFIIVVVSKAIGSAVVHTFK